MRSENFERALEEVARMPASGINTMLIMENSDMRKQLAEKDFLIDQLMSENNRLKGNLQ